ncbi:hypothetical protein ER308_20480 [Egibacter rhizosphaerae]|uniref:Uncharacterized protein n=1 Tax=Egibacter rhizosphaerae TaxID=1670831 RepID=A0A411YKG5_9ACTN|nr:hypothetical protein [Egibacter rhizosphaerae]QBI21708.1 hypothetical protein ER308_20480 [Egibacter rhizosphaerae]
MTRNPVDPPDGVPAHPSNDGDVPQGPSRDTEVIRRARRAGGLVALTVGGLLVTGVVGLGGSGRAGGLAALVGLLFGVMVTAGWLVLAGLLDLAADELPSRRRVVWTIASAAMAGSLPPLLVGVAHGIV